MKFFFLCIIFHPRIWLEDCTYAYTFVLLLLLTLYIIYWSLYLFRMHVLHMDLSILYTIASTINVLLYVYDHNPDPDQHLNPGRKFCCWIYTQVLQNCGGTGYAGILHIKTIGGSSLSFQRQNIYTFSCTRRVLIINN